MKLFKKIIFILSFFFLLTASNAVFAAGILPSESGKSESNCVSKNGCGNYTVNDMLQLVVNVSTWILGVVGSLVLIFFVYGGFVFILSGGNEEKVAEGKKILTNAIIGLIIVFASYLIVQFVGSLLGVKTVSVPGITNIFKKG